MHEEGIKFRIVGRQLHFFGVPVLAPRRGNLYYRRHPLVESSAELAAPLHAMEVGADTAAPAGDSTEPFETFFKCLASVLQVFDKSSSELI